MLLREKVFPWPPIVSPFNNDEEVERLVLRSVLLKTYPHVRTPYLRLQLERTPETCYAFVFSEERGCLEKLKALLTGHLGKTLREVGDLPW